MKTERLPNPENPTPDTAYKPTRTIFLGLSERSLLRQLEGLPIPAVTIASLNGVNEAINLLYATNFIDDTTCEAARIKLMETIKKAAGGAHFPKRPNLRR